MRLAASSRVPTRQKAWVSTRFGHWIGLGLAVALAGGAALISAWLTPRGPATTPEALVSMVAAIAVGVGGGLVMRSRWAMLVCPIVFLLVYEFARAGTTGPTVDRIELGSTYGIIAFVVGRLVHGLLVLAPMTLGAAYGVWLASGRRTSGSGLTKAAKWTLTGLATLALVGLVVLVARPGTTAPILGPAGEPVPGSIAELTSVRIGGHDQALMIRGRSTDDPVLLYLAGGPGGTDLGAMRADAGLEQDFVVVTWEQRGSGKSYAALDPVDTLTLEQTVADTVELTDYLRDRFGQDRIYLVGNSWGTILGVLAVQEHPELFHAFVGTGQMVSPRATDIMFYEDTLAWADQTGNDAVAATLSKDRAAALHEPARLRTGALARA